MPRSKTVLVVSLGILFAVGVTMLIVFRHNIANEITVASGKRAIARHEAAPVGLTQTISHFGWPAEHFAKITSFPAWGTVPRGFQVFDHVPFQIDGAFALWGEANAKRLKIVFPEEIPDIAVNEKFETLYLLHCTFFVEPNKTPVYEVVFHYEDGLTATNQLCYGDDVLDWVANRHGRVVGPTAPNSKLAWVGGAWSPKDKTPMRLCLSALTNPMPFQKVTTIDLRSCKSISAGCVFAMTTGRKGLMQ